MISPNFNIVDVKDQFKANLPECFDMFGNHYSDEDVERMAKKLWDEFGVDIICDVESVFNGCPDFTDEYERSIAVLTEYVKKLKEIHTFETNNNDYSIERYWADIVRVAMMENAQSLFNAKGPCDYYGELIEEED